MTIIIGVISLMLSVLAYLFFGESLPLKIWAIGCAVVLGTRIGYFQSFKDNSSLLFLVATPTVIASIVVLHAHYMPIDVSTPFIKIAELFADMQVVVISLLHFFIPLCLALAFYTVLSFREERKSR